MAKIGVKGLTYAPYVSGGEGGAVSYGTGVKLDDYMIRADVSEERADTDFYADDHKIDSDNSMTGTSIALELANFTDDLEKTLLGYVAVNSGAELNVTDKPAGFVGVGFMKKERFKGSVKYKGYWFYKVQFTKDSDSTNTKGESLEFQTENVTGDAMAVQLTSGGDSVFYATTRKDSESDVRSWLNTKAGIV